MFIPSIEYEVEFTDFLVPIIKSAGSYLNYARNASKALGKAITISDFKTSESLHEHLSMLKEIMAKEDYSNTQSSLKRYQQFAAIFNSAEDEYTDEEDSVDTTTKETDNKVIFEKVAKQHQAAFDFFKASGTSKQQELLVEYSFLRELIIQAAAIGKSMSISRSDFDAYGFDLLLGMDDKVLQVQMKAYNGKASLWDVHKSLLRSEQGRVVIAHVQPVDGLLQMRYKMLRKTNVGIALARPPKNKKEGRCKVILGDLDDITDDLLRLFI